jgi:hypothetical protein
MTKRLLMLAILLALPSLVGADREEYSASSLAGTYQCQITAFQWPHSRGDPLMQNSHGTSEVVADGSGQLSEGSMSLHSVREENEGIPCKYGLRNGSYTINPDGSGRTDGEWKFMEGGGSGWKCFDRGLPPNGRQVGVVKPGPVFMESMLATKSGARTYNVLYDQNGITISVCDRK